jgi:hypothetical protein
LLPVKVSSENVAVRLEKSDGVAMSGTMEIKVGKGLVRIAGPVDVEALRAVLEYLAG